MHHFPEKALSLSHAYYIRCVLYHMCTRTAITLLGFALAGRRGPTPGKHSIHPAIGYLPPLMIVAVLPQKRCGGHTSHRAPPERRGHLVIHVLLGERAHGFVSKGQRTLEVIDD